MPRWAQRAARIAGALSLLVATGAGYQACSTARGLAAHPAPGRLVDVGGHRLHVWCQGEGTPAVLFEAGGLGGFAMYEHIVPQIAKRTRACAYDRGGMGFSEPGPAPRDADRLASELERLLEAADERGPYVLVAHSAGGFVARLFARRHPAQISGLVLLDSIHEDFIDQIPTSARNTLAMVEVARWLSRVGVLRLLDPLGMDADPSDPRGDRARTVLYRPQTWDATASLVRSLPASADQVRGAAALPRSIPVTVIPHETVGDLLGPGTDLAEARDAEARWQELQRELAARSDGGRYVVAERSGHMVALERPDLVVAEVLRMLRGAETPRHP